MLNGVVPPVHEINTICVPVSLYSLSAWHGATRKLLPTVTLVTTREVPGSVLG